MRKGYTLVELMVAVTCAAILSVVAWNVFASFQKTSVHLLADYQWRSGRFFLEIQQVTKNARGLGERFQNRF